MVRPRRLPLDLKLSRLRVVTSMTVRGGISAALPSGPRHILRRGRTCVYMQGLTGDKSRLRGAENAAARAFSSDRAMHLHAERPSRFGSRQGTASPGLSTAWTGISTIAASALGALCAATGDPGLHMLYVEVWAIGGFRGIVAANGYEDPPWAGSEWPRCSSGVAAAQA